MVYLFSVDLAQYKIFRVKVRDIWQVSKYKYQNPIFHIHVWQVRIKNQFMTLFIVCFSFIGIHV